MDSAPSPSRIELLPEHLIDQIKAGEVIERPGNLIKEILENAVDAGATKIELTLKNNGLDLISLKDNGHGINSKDLPLAFCRHATSKISRFEDLYKLHSYGFRGEALASICAISKLQCITYTDAEKEGSEIRIEGGETIFNGTRQKIGTGRGTELVIQDLFYNTPARLKFIQSQQSERTFIRKIFYAFLMARPGIEFHLKIDETEKEIFPAHEKLKDRIEDIIPKARGFIQSIQKFYENFELDLHLVPGHFKAPLKIQNIYINDRYILDKQLHRVLCNALQASFGVDDFHYVALFNLPADNVDVNVHPNKTIVKVLENSKLMSLLTSTVRELSSQGKKTERPVEKVNIPAASLPNMFAEAPTLQQERHHYNMEGFFSPHSLPTERNENFIWVGRYFLQLRGSEWMAVAPSKLLEQYITEKLKKVSVNIPLLVSEPYSAKGVKKEHLSFLQSSGLEIEFLSSDTLVLRSIPEWMNGFPLKDILGALLQGSPLNEIEINPDEWSQTTWEDMLSFFPETILREKKICLPLSSLLEEKLK